MRYAEVEMVLYSAILLTAFGLIGLLWSISDGIRGALRRNRSRKHSGGGN